MKGIALEIFNRYFNITNFLQQSTFSHFTARCLFSITLIAVEMILLSIRFDTASFQEISHPLYDLFGYSGWLLRFAIGAFGAAVIFMVPRWQVIHSIIAGYFQNPSRWLWLLPHLTTCVLFYYLTAALFEDIPKTFPIDPSNIYIFGVAWLLSGLVAFVSLLLVIANNIFWIKLFSSEYKTIAISAIAGLLVQGIGLLSALAWKPLADITFGLSSQVLSFFFDPIFSDPVKHILGTKDFRVEISSQCSGYEGMGLIAVFVGLYLWIFRHQLRFPQALLLFPFGITTMWLLNVMRIVALISIGNEISPDIAVGGFHSNAGWIAFVLLSVSLIFLCQKIAYFNNRKQKIKPNNNISKATPLLMPFIILLATILVTAAFSAKFDWLYPIKVIVAVITLWYFRSKYQPYLTKPSVQSILIGSIVFVLWLLLVPTSQSVDQQFADTLFSQNVIIAYGWLFFRFIGASLTVPVIEELAFRGYIIAKLVDVRFERVTPGQFTWFSFLGSSILFGALHGNWLAGILAGMLYAYALYQRKALIDAVFAHMITNMMLSFYVVYTEHWSLW